MFDKAIEGRWRGHQLRLLFKPGVSNGTRQLWVMQILPEPQATLFQPDIERIQILEGWRTLPDPMPGVLNILLNLPLLPA